MQPTTHTVVAGETLSGIAAKYGVNYQDIAKANGIANPDLIYPGQTFTIPGAKAGSTPAPAPVVTPPSQSTPQSTPSTPAPTSGGNPPNYAPNTVNQTVSLPDGTTWRGQPGQGWTQISGGGNNGASTTSGQPTFDLVAATNAAYNTPEITAANKSIADAQAELTTRQQALADAQANINDNPFYSEATRVGKSKKLTQEANNDMTVIQNKIKTAQDTLAGLKADAAIKVQAATGQYNIEEQQYKDNLSMFNNLVSSGALDNASGSDLADWSVKTGIPTSMMQSIQAASQKKDNPLSIVQSTDNSGNLTILAVDKSGKVVNQTTVPGVASSKTGSGSATSEKDQNIANLTQDIKNKVTLKSLVQHYGAVLSIDQIYQLYNQNSPWGPAKETLAQVKAGKYAD